MKNSLYIIYLNTENFSFSYFRFEAIFSEKAFSEKAFS